MCNYYLSHFFIFFYFSQINTKHDLTKTEVDSETARGRRDVIEEERFYNIRSESTKKENTYNQPTPWLPQPLSLDEDPTTKISITNDAQEVMPLFQTTERVTDKPTGRGARASNENWIKLPYPNRDDEDIRDAILTPPQPSGELLNSRMPRVNFITQNKVLDTSESRNNKEAVQRQTRNDEIRTEFVRPGEDPRGKNYKPVYPRQAVYYPEESRRYFYDDRYLPPDDLYRRNPYDPRRNYDYPRYVPRVDRYDDVYDSSLRKPKRIIYYAHLPEVVRTPPSVDLRYRYIVDPYRRFDDDYNARSGRYDYRFRNRYPYPYAPLRKEERNYRDLAGSGTVNKDKKIEDKVTAAPVLPQKDDKFNGREANIIQENRNRNNINSHQYHDNTDSRYTNSISKNYPDIVRHEDTYLRYEDPLFHSTIDDPYGKRY